jgi:hypothetical protein
MATTHKRSPPGPLRRLVETASLLRREPGDESLRLIDGEVLWQARSREHRGDLGQQHRTGHQLDPAGEGCLEDQHRGSLWIARERCAGRAL